MLSTATNYMPEVVSDFPYDFKKMLESYPQELKEGLQEIRDFKYPDTHYSIQI
jgi:hypothetical protein